MNTTKYNITTQYKLYKLYKHKTKQLNIHRNQIHNSQQKLKNTKNTKYMKHTKYTTYSNNNKYTQY